MVHKIVFLETNLGDYFICASVVPLLTFDVLG